MIRGSVLAEGKTKVVHLGPEPYTVLLEAKDDITAGDGARRVLIPDKANLATATTGHCFALLGRHGIPNHYLGPVDARTFAARMVRMIPLEVVIRRRAAGSFPRRHPGTAVGTIFDEPLVEFYLKDSYLHDPYVVFGPGFASVLLYRANVPPDAGFIVEQPLDTSPLAELTPALVTQLQTLATRTFRVLEDAWIAQNITLVDLKIECGFDAATGALLVADVIDNDSWRLWVGGSRRQMLDKQLFRDLRSGLTGPALVRALEKIHRAYVQVADMTARFN